MDFRVYVIVEAPILDRKYELMIPIDRRIHDYDPAQQFHGFGFYGFVR